MTFHLTLNVKENLCNGKGLRRTDVRVHSLKTASTKGFRRRPQPLPAPAWQRFRVLVKWHPMRPMSLAIVTALTLAAYIQPAAKAHKTRLPSALAFRAAAAFAAGRGAPSEAAMQVHSNVISPGGEFPKRETCDGRDTSPQLAWSGAPPATKSFALILDDPDAPSGTFTHWIVWNIPAGAHELPAAVSKTAESPDGTRQGRNDFGKIGYGGPCPPPGKPHRYFFRVYALDHAPAVKAGAGRGDLERAMQGHILAQGELMGRYGR